MPSLIIAGAGTWAQSLATVARRCLGASIAAYAVDREYCDRDAIGDVPLREISEVLDSEDPADCEWLIGIVDYRHRMKGRADAVDRLHARGHRIRGLVEPSACVDGGSIHPTATVLAGAIVGPDACLGPMSILVQGAVVGHHTVVGPCCYIAPGASISGNVTIGERTFIGVGAVVRDGISIGSRCLIGAGAVVLADVPDETVVIDRHAPPPRPQTAATPSS
jgi:sugar O-acyltransferase (sialic acid O-acetyltransferase NeuD family)